MYEMLNNIIQIHISKIFLNYLYFFNYKQQTDFFVTIVNSKFMTFLSTLSIPNYYKYRYFKDLSDCFEIF